MVNYGEEMLSVMGGYGCSPAVQNFQPQPGADFMRDNGDYGWTNELHIFNIKFSEEKKCPPIMYLQSFIATSTHNYGGYQNPLAIEWWLPEASCNQTVPPW